MTSSLSVNLLKEEAGQLNTRFIKLTVSSFIADLLQRRTLLTIHSIFEQGMNLMSEEYGLIFLSSIKLKQNGREVNKTSSIASSSDSKAGHNLSAIGLVVEGIDFKELKDGLEIGQLVKITSQSITFYKGNHSLILLTKQLEVEDLSLFDRTMDQSDALVLDSAVIPRLINAIESVGQLNHSAFMQLPHLECLAQAFENEEAEYSFLFQQLIGLGLGLTPSGDDFLLGFLMMEQFFAKEHGFKVILRPLLANASTTDVSLAYYRAFMDGYASSEWINLYQALSQKDCELVCAAIKHISNIGNTSGSDILFGCLTYLRNIKNDNKMEEINE